jgi:hypothetical protein
VCDGEGMSDKNPVWHIKNNVDRPYPVGARISYAPMGEPVGIINGPFMGIEPIYKPYYRRIVDKEALVQKFIYGTIESNIGPGQVRVWRGDDGWKWERPFDLDKAKSVNYQLSRLAWRSPRIADSATARTPPQRIGAFALSTDWHGYNIMSYTPGAIFSAPNYKGRI